MARICPLCGEEVVTDPQHGFPHICKSIPMPTIGQCKECGTALNDLNVSDLYPGMCMGCHNKLPGDRDTALAHIAHKGKMIMVKYRKDSSWAIWVYLASQNRLKLDLLRRSYGGRICHHRNKVYKWTCNRIADLRILGIDMEKAGINVAPFLLKYTMLPQGVMRYAYVEDLQERLEAKLIHIQKGPTPGPPG